MEKHLLENRTIKTWLKKSSFLLLAFVLVFIIDRIAIILTDRYLAGSFGYTWLSVHHTLQIILVLTILALPIWHKSAADWGLNTRNLTETRRIILRFTIGWVIGSTLFTLVTQWLSGWPPLLDFNLNLENILIYLFFESVIVGISEELVFRGLAYGILHSNFGRKVKLIGFSLSSAGILSAIIFALAHIGFQISPFAITTFAPMQVLVAFVLGIFYAVVREKTGSLLGPILAHNISDGWLSILYIIIQTITQR